MVNGFLLNHEPFTMNHEPNFGGLAQLARAPALQAGGQRFESVILHSCEEVYFTFYIVYFTLLATRSLTCWEKTKSWNCKSDFKRRRFHKDSRKYTRRRFS